MIKATKKSLQLSVDREVLEAVEKVCETLSQYMGYKVTKSMLFVHMFNKFLDGLIDNKQIKEQEESNKDIGGN